MLNGSGVSWTSPEEVQKLKDNCLAEIVNMFGLEGYEIARIPELIRQRVRPLPSENPRVNDLLAANNAEVERRRTAEDEARRLRAILDALDVSTSEDFQVTPDEHNAIRLILAELRRAKSIHPGWYIDAVHAASVLAEEAGETVRAALRYTYEGAPAADVRTEIAHTGAMAIRFLANSIVMAARQSQCVDDG